MNEIKIYPIGKIENKEGSVWEAIFRVFTSVQSLFSSVFSKQNFVIAESASVPYPFP